MRLFDVETRGFSVWAVYNESGICQVMNKMRQVSRDHQDLAQQMAVLLYEEIPVKGPPEDPWRFGPLYDEIIYELKAREYVTQDKSIGLRIACFFDGPRVVVCTNAFYKTGPTPPDQVSLARREHERYFQDKALGRLEFVGWPLR
jgi:hypothetical protein